MTFLKTFFREVFCIIIIYMNKQGKRIIVNFIIVMTLVTFANCLMAMPNESAFGKRLQDVISFVIYEGLLAYWGISIMRRIMHVRVRRYLILSCITEMFWVVLRCCKWYLFYSPLTERLLLYSYYIPLLILAYCVFCVSECIREKNIKRLRNNRSIVFTVTVFLSVFMLTNEFHHLAFRVDEESGSYTHFVGYLLVAFWVGALIIYSVFRLPKNEGKTGKDKSLPAPYSVLAFGILFCIFELLKDYYGWNIHVSYTEGMSLISIGFWESLIQTGKIPFNSDYTWCFNHSSVKAQVLDKKGRRIYSSIEARNLTKDEIYDLMGKGYSHQYEDIELRAVNIKGGIAVWERDNSDINKSIKRLRETLDSVAEAKESLEETFLVEKKHQSINEQNHLYDITFKAVSGKFDKLLKLIDKAYVLTGSDLRRTLIKIDIIGVYVKRKINLLLLSQTGIKDFTKELNLCFKESFDNMKDAGIVASYAFFNLESITYETAEKLYTMFEDCIEDNINNISALNVLVSKSEKGETLTVNIEKKENIFDFSLSEAYKDNADISFDMESDDSEVTLSFRTLKGGV